MLYLHVFSLERLLKDVCFAALCLRIRSAKGQMENYMGNFANVFHLMVNMPMAMRCRSFGDRGLFGRSRACSEF
jgi:hypothetical protein